MRDARHALCLALGLLVPAGCAWALPPSPLDQPGLSAFPGAVENPPSAVSAGLGLADLWLGDEPFGNPAAASAREVVLAPVFVRVSRQDLRAVHRNYDETAGFFDAAGGRISWPVGGASVSLYAGQPVLRLEDNAYTRVPPDQPGTFRTTSSTREKRAGLAVSHGWRALRLGLAGEWTRRDEVADFEEKSGSPASGTRHADFGGEALGFQAGFRYASNARLVMGGAVRCVPALDLEGERRQELLLGSDTTAIAVRREAAWEGGVSVRAAVTDAFRLLAAAGGRGAQAWEGFGVEAGPAVQWSLGLEFHDERDPWTLRCGAGQEVQRGVPEPRAGLVSLGFGWRMEGVVLDAAILRRSLQRADRPTSYDDRVLVGATVPF
jgi:hypothetical protein